jgi:hypothetical protein
MLHPFEGTNIDGYVLKNDAMNYLLFLNAERDHIVVITEAQRELYVGSIRALVVEYMP